MQIENNVRLLAGLKAFGLNKKEADIYLAGLYLGPATVIEIARRAKLPRTTAYSILETLIGEGLFNRDKKKKCAAFVAAPVTELEKIFQDKQLAFQGIIKDLGEIKNLNYQKPRVAIFAGADGFKKIWQKILSSGVKDYRLISSGNGMLEYVKEKYLIKKIIADRIKKGIKSRQLLVECREAKAIVARDQKELRESRFLPFGSEIPASILIYGNKVACFTSRRENVQVEAMSGDLAATLRTLFDQVWEKAKKPSEI